MEYNNKNKIIINLFFTLFSLAVIFLNIRGQLGTPNSADLNSRYWKEDGPLELSPERGRYALTYSILEDKSVHFSRNIAEFATPDLGIINGHYVSLFAPFVSFLVIPGYLIGQIFNASQLGSFAMIGLFAIANSILIRKTSLKLGADLIAANLASLVFLFATPAFTYSVSLYQHHISTFLILLSSYSLLFYGGFFSLGLFWSCYALAIGIDYPNIFLLLPILFLSFSKIFKITQKPNMKIRIIARYTPVVLLFLIPIFFLFWFNNLSYGRPTILSGTTTRVFDIDKNNLPTIPNSSDLEKNSKYNSIQFTTGTSPFTYFKTRNTLNGLNVLLASRDRGVIFYAPIITFGLLGIVFFKLKNRYAAYTLTGVVIVNILIYSMWGDPWGGWSFGSRYLIPSYSILAIFCSIFLTKFKSNAVLLILFLSIFAYSLYVNTAGAITTSALPPKIEVLNLENVTGKVQKYTYSKNLDLINEGKIKSFLYKQFLEGKISSRDYFYIVFGTIMAAATLGIISLYLSNSLNNFKKIKYLPIFSKLKFKFLPGMK